MQPIEEPLLQLLSQVYHQDVLARLRESRVESEEDIEWLRVMRFYMEGEVSVFAAAFFLA